MTEPSWGTGARLAWTEHDGPPPRAAGPGPICTTALGATTLAVAWALNSDQTLCPAHQMWVHNLAFGSLACALAALPALLQRRPVGVVLTLASAGLGLAVSLIGLGHDGALAWLLSTALAVPATVAALLLAHRAVRARADRRWLRALFAGPPEHPAPVPADADPALLR